MTLAGLALPSHNAPALSKGLPQHTARSLPPPSSAGVASLANSANRPMPTRVNTGLVAVTDLSPLLLMNDLNFKAASVGNNRDFVVTISEVGGASTGGSISFRVFKLSAFTITYPTSSGISDVFPGIANSNSEWDFVDGPDYVTVTSKTGVIIDANSNKKIGFSISRKAGVPDNTSQNLTVSLVAGSGGETVYTDNLSGVRVWARETPTPLAFSIVADSVKLNPYGYHAPVGIGYVCGECVGQDIHSGKW